MPGAYAAPRQTHSPRLGTSHILLIRPDHLGDLLLTTPVLHALKTRAPGARITMMAGPWSSEVVARHPDIDEVITFPFPGFQRALQKPWTPYVLLFSAARQLRWGNYDLVINLRPDFWWGAALAYLARIPRRVGYAISPGTPFLTRALPYPPHQHWTVSALRLASAGLETLGYAALEEPFTAERYPLEFTPTADERRWVAERLSKAGIDAQVPVVVIHAGAGAPVKLWRTQAWSDCANALTTLLTGPVPVRIILTGSKNERPVMEEIARGIASPVLLVSDATVGQLAALLARAQLVLGVDSGPLHMAVAQGTPSVRIYGPTDARMYGPWGPAEQHLVVASTRCCPGCPLIPCGRIDFRPEELAAHPCVRLVAEQEVLAAASRLYLLPGRRPGDEAMVEQGDHELGDRKQDESIHGGGEPHKR